MEYTFNGFMKNSVIRNKIPFTVLALFTVLSVLLTVFRASISSFTFAAFFIAFLSAWVSFICVMISTFTRYYRAVHKSGIKKFDHPLSLILSAISSNIVLCAVILMFVAATMFSFASVIRGAEIPSALSQDIATLKELGYSDISFIASLTLCLFCEYLEFLAAVICSISLARLFRERKVLVSVLGVFFVNLIGSYIKNILISLTAHFASGIYDVVNSINDFYNGFINSITTRESFTIPYASDFTKLYCFTATCTLILIISYILISKAALTAKLPDGGNNTDNKNNNI